MNKKVLKSWSEENLIEFNGDKEYIKNTEIEKDSVVVTAREEIIDNERVMVNDIYKIYKNKFKDDVEFTLEGQYFTSEDDYCWYDGGKFYNVKAEKCEALYHNAKNWYTSKKVFIVDRASYPVLEHFATEWQGKEWVDKNFQYAIDNNRIIEYVLEKKHERIGYERTIKRNKKKEIAYKNDMKKFKPVDKERISKFIEKNMQPLLFYKKNKAWCSSCKKDVVLKEKAVHNKEAVCPHCKRKAIYKSAGRTLRTYVTHMSILKFENLGNGELGIRYMEAYRSYPGAFKEPKIGYADVIRTVLKKDDKGKMVCEMYEKGKYGYFAGKWRPNKKIDGYAVSSTCLYYNAILYGNAKRTIDASMLKYSNVTEVYNEMKNRKNDAWGRKYAVKTDERKFSENEKTSSFRLNLFFFQSYLENFIKYPFTEYLVKMGKYSILDSVLSDKSPFKFKESQDILKGLGINKYQYNRLMKFNNPSSDLLKLYQKVNRENLSLSEKCIDFLEKCSWHLITRILNQGVFDYIGPTKLENYIDKLREYNLKNGITENPLFFLNEWLDCFDAAKQYKNNLNLPLTQFDILPPADAFDRKFNYFVMENKKKNKREYIEKIDTILDDLKEKYYFEDKETGIVVTPPIKSSDEIIVEGTRLHHCVEGYLPKMAAGNTTILFVRKKEDMNKPFYTMEVSDGKIVQCRGYKNEAMTSDVKITYEKYDNFLKKMATA